jgi:hypothetical protein
MAAGPSPPNGRQGRRASTLGARRTPDGAKATRGATVAMQREPKRPPDLDTRSRGGKKGRERHAAAVLAGRPGYSDGGAARGEDLGAAVPRVDSRSSHPSSALQGREREVSRSGSTQIHVEIDLIEVTTNLIWQGETQFDVE